MKRIYLRSIGPDIPDVLDALTPRIRAAFGIEVRRMPPIELPQRAFNPHRCQYLSSAMFPPLEAGLPQDALRILGVTTADLYVPQLNFVFGEAKLGGPSAVISIHRLRPEFYGDRPNRELMLKRAEIEAVHELGHTFGVRHCPKPDCVMHFSNNIAESDRKGAGFCEDCSGTVRDTVRKQTAGFTRSGGLSEL